MDRPADHETAAADPATVVRSIHRVLGGVPSEELDHLAAEAPLEIRLRDVPLAVLMRTPGHDADLCTGFLLTEGILLGPGELAAVAPVAGDPNRWVVDLAEGVAVDPGQFQRNVYTSSSCGVCGKASIDAVRVAARPVPEGPRVPHGVLAGLGATLRASQTTFSATGGLHAAALFDSDGMMSILREDIGRHNAVDKVVGAVAADRWPIGERLLLVSGRVSFEIVQKAAVAGIPFVCGVSAASSLAVELGTELDMTVVGFLRGGDLNIYTGARRIVL